MSAIVAHLGPICAAPLFPPDANTAVLNASVFRYYHVVLSGRVPGIYVELVDALLQIEDFPGARYHRLATYGGALHLWSAECRQNHSHEYSYTVTGVDGIFTSCQVAIETLIQRFVQTT
ncbi:hypothetical protein B0H17DRAFT_1219701 [Mycena rosella]|uniref:Ribonuclease H1 N-terminal domain-containing protein n=1 Tax=Mycena rosella TaxID=1033263 RepID=A0AAD7BFP4_MYCRO|nr:hypothetical protein B0H17DRAFT_1219701 [Mycena rosella]